MASENWRPIKGFEGKYEASDAGRIRSVDSVVHFASRWGKQSERMQPGTVLRPLRHTGGYQRVALWLGGKCTQAFIHSLVLTAFVGDRPAGMQACHNNGDKQDNALANLRWDTPSANQADREAHGTGRRGKLRVTRRVNETLAAEVRAAHQGNITSTAKVFELPRTTVADIINGRTWRHVNG